MARLFDALTHADTRRPAAVETVAPWPTSRPAAFTPADADAEDADALDVPFIEVGSPRPKVAPPTPSAPVAVPPAPTAPTDAVAYLTIQFQALALAGAGSARFAPELVAVHHPDHAIAAQYRGMFAELAAQANGGTPGVLLITAASAAAGTTTVLLNLAATAARAGSRVVVVDANLARPAVGERLGLGPCPGLREVLAHTVPLAWGVQPTGLNHLSALPAGQVPQTASVEGWAELLGQLRSRFDWVLIDAPAWGTGPVAPVLASACDAAYLVLRQDELASPEVADLRQAVTERGGRLKGYVLTRR